jgi:hypothetical protein
LKDGIDVGVGMDQGGRDGVVTGLRARICVGAGVCARWSIHVGVFMLCFQIGVVKLVCSDWGVQVEVLWEFLGFHSFMK